MSALEFTIIALAVEGALYLLLLAVTLKRGSLRDGMARTLVLYGALSGLWVLAQLAGQLGWLDLPGLNAYLVVRLPLYGLVLLAMLFLYLTRSFLRLPGQAWGWAVLGGAWFGGLIALDLQVVALPAGQAIGQQALTVGIAAAGWGLFMAVALLLTRRAFRQAQLPLHRNRLIYWLIAWAITLGGDLLYLAGYPVLGGDVRLLGTLVAAYVVLTHRLPDVRQTLRRALSYTIITLLTVVIYTAGFMAVQYFFQNVPGYDPLWAGAAVALVLAILFDPLLRLVQKLVNRLLTGSGYDPGQLVREYSMRISNIVSLERLATTVVDLVGERLEIEHGQLFVVHYERDESGAGLYRLRVTGDKGQEAPAGGSLSVESAVTGHLRGERLPLTQYDLDLLPEFAGLDPAERDWLESLGVDVYVPIHSQGSWIGLLALGPKRSGNRYFDEDLRLLGTLADQTAIALENARLVDDLIEINHDLEQAYATLAEANRQLQEMDRLKSAFIGVITHELRSPFANIAFSLQLFTRQGVANLTQEQHEQLEQLTTSLQQAKGMIDNLVNFATFLSKQGELELDQLDFGEVIRETMQPLHSMAEAKGVYLHVIVPKDLPPLQGDRERLSDAVHHLAHNALKFTEAGGQVWARCQARDSLLHFEVEDTGVGVPQERLPALWEGFAQMADPLQRGVEGLGLGLALVKYIVNAHGGRVRAESKEGKGSTFAFEIPLQGPHTAPAPDPASAPVPDFMG